MATTKSERLRQARQKAGFETAADAAGKFNWPESAYRHHENGTRGFGPDSAKKYGRAFRVNPGWLLALEKIEEAPPPEPIREDRLIVNGSVAAGVWRESEHWDDERKFQIDGMPSPVPGAKRFGLIVDGYSMDEFYDPGTVLDCVSIFKGGTRPASGDHVIVQQIRPDGLRELTVKEYREEQGQFLLVPRTTKPEFKPVEFSGPDKEHVGDDGIQVIGFVMAAYPPRTLDLMRRMGLLKPTI